jgi:NitT/TauT family transport system substrate-binding protein
VLAAAPALAQQKVDFVLNWVPGGDHAPYYYAKKMGWYTRPASTCRSSPARARRWPRSAWAPALPDRPGRHGRRAGGQEQGRRHGGGVQRLRQLAAGHVLAEELGHHRRQGLPGKKIGNPAADGARTMWPALAKANGIDPKSVTWVNIDANAKLASLKAKSIDVTTSFYNIHHIFQRELGDDMGFLAWRDAGLNPYGNSVIVNAKFLEANRPLVDRFVKVTQRAFAACVKEPSPCVQALIDANGALKFDNELTNWSLVEKLMSDKFSREVALGIHDDARMAADYELVREYIGIDKPFDVKTTYTNEFLDRSIKMTK